ncbi:MAG: hypothetical protein RL095_882 [Verrucomicrobiota bacterium]|jgi:uncharacterized protein (DUF362 family)
MTPRLDQISLHSYERQGLKAALLRLLAPHGGLAALAPGKRVLLKPNFVMPEKPEDPSCTHPDFYMAVAELLLEEGRAVSIGESPAFGSCEKGLRMHGVYDECRSRGIGIVEFSGSRKFEGVAGDSWYEELSVAGELRDFDAVINLPKLKVHQQFVLTGAVKNLYGCVVGRRKFLRHNLCDNDPRRFARMIIANADAVAATLHLGDGIVAMHIKGPRGGRPYPLGQILLAQDPYAHDWLQALLMDHQPHALPLFQALDPARLEAARAAAEALFHERGLKPATSLVPSFRTDISFSPRAILRSAWRLLKFKLRR